MSQRFAVQAHFFGLLLVLLLPVAGHAQELLAELPHVDSLAKPNFPGCCPEPLPVSLTFCLGSGVPTFQVGTPPYNSDLNPVIGCGQPIFPSHSSPTYFDFHAGNSPQFADLASTLTNRTHEALWVCALSLDSSNNVTLPSGCTGGDGAEPALNGSVVDFIRLVVNRVSVGLLTPHIRIANFDVVWQFWNGPAQFSGSGQRTDVNEFLQYGNPLERSVLLAAADPRTGMGTTSFPLTIVYGPTIDAGSFTSELNGESFGGFTPAPGTTETVYVPVVPGRNVLTFSVEGFASNGHLAKDKDRLVLIVP
jgi:hypothetical protein